MFASCAPVTKPTDAGSGIPSSSLSQPPATSSAAAAAGDSTGLNAHWSHPEASMSAAVAAGSAPPMTNPKNRGPALDIRPPSAASTRSWSTSDGAVGCFANGPPNARRRASMSRVGTTRRSGRLLR